MDYTPEDLKVGQFLELLALLVNAKCIQSNLLESETDQSQELLEVGNDIEVIERAILHLKRQIN